MVRRFYLTACFVLVASGINSIAQGQIALDLDFIVTHNPINPEKGTELSSFTFEQTNELKVGLMGLIRLYQLFISTQDMSVCNFTPSCSKFGMASFKEHGVFHGILMTSDRLQRCHGLGRGYYPIHPETGKCDDPVGSNCLGAE